MPDAVDDHLALALIPGLGPKLTAALIERFGSASAARRATAAQLRTIPHIGEKLADSFATALRIVNVSSERDLLAKHGVRPVPLGDPAYPSPLAAVNCPPPLLYFHGEWTPADVGGIAIVGSRSCTSYGKKMAELLARGLVRAGITVVSGLARGIDGTAHKATLDAGGRTIAVLAGGLSEIYPPEHAGLAAEVAKQGALVSETPMTVAPQPGMFPARNRVISGLTRATVVIEANARSGALITARHAGEQGREVFAFPGNVDSAASAGCLELIRNGARLIRGIDDLLEDLKGIAQQVPEQPRKPSPTLFEEAPPAAEPPPILDASHRAIWELLTEKRHADELTRGTGLSVSELSRALTQMELKRLVRRLPGNFYERR
jgi:DNA processing protein